MLPWFLDKSIMPEISTIAVMMTTVDGSFSPAARTTLARGNACERNQNEGKGSQNF